MPIKLGIPRLPPDADKRLRIIVNKLAQQDAQAGVQLVTPYAATMTLDTGTLTASMKSITTTNAIGNSTLNAASVGQPGQPLTILIYNDATAPRTITFNTNFRANGNLVGQANKASTISFESDGTAWFETGRVVGI